METLGAIIGPLGFVALLVGAILFLPLASVRRHRSLAKKLVIGGAVAFIAGVSMSPPPPPNKAGLKDTATAKNGAAGTSAADAEAEKLAANERFISLYHQVISTAKPCDDAAGVLQKAANGGNTLATYQAAKAGREACQNAAIEMRKLEAPEGLNGEATAMTNKALTTCANAYVYRQMGMDKAIEVADGDNRPSVISEMIENMKTAQAGTMLCIGKFLETSNNLGIDAKRLQ